MTQKELKQLKKDIVTESARNIGYVRTVINRIPSYALLEATKELAVNGWITAHTSDIELENMLITQAIAHMNYQDFKKIAPFFFGYRSVA